jgi:hypothetical protein
VEQLVQPLQENGVFLTQKAVAHDTFVRQTLWFHPLQCTICGVYVQYVVAYSGIYYIQMAF